MIQILENPTEKIRVEVRKQRGIGNTFTYAIKVNGVRKVVYYNEDQVRSFLKGLGVEYARD